MVEDLVRRCCVCKRTETPPTKNSKYSDGFLSLECYGTFYKKDIELGIIPKDPSEEEYGIKLNSCNNLYPQIKS